MSNKDVVRGWRGDTCGHSYMPISPQRSVVEGHKVMSDRTAELDQLCRTVDRRTDLQSNRRQHYNQLSGKPNDIQPQ